MYNEDSNILCSLYKIICSSSVETSQCNVYTMACSVCSRSIMLVSTLTTLALTGAQRNQVKHQQAYNKKNLIACLIPQLSDLLPVDCLLAQLVFVRQCLYLGRGRNISKIFACKRKSIVLHMIWEGGWNYSEAFVMRAVWGLDHTTPHHTTPHHTTYTTPY